MEDNNTTYEASQTTVEHFKNRIFTSFQSAPGTFCSIDEIQDQKASLSGFGIIEITQSMLSEHSGLKLEKQQVWGIYSVEMNNYWIKEYIMKLEKSFEANGNRKYEMQLK